MSLVRADGLVTIPRFCEGLDAGQEVLVELWRSPDSLAGAIVVIGSHDLTLDLLASELRRGNPDLTLASSNVGSLGGLLALSGERRIWLARTSSTRRPESTTSPPFDATCRDAPWWWSISCSVCRALLCHRAIPGRLPRWPISGVMASPLSTGSAVREPGYCWIICSRNRPLRRRRLPAMSVRSIPTWRWRRRWLGGTGGGRPGSLIGSAGAGNGLRAAAQRAVRPGHPQGIL